MRNYNVIFTKLDDTEILEILTWQAERFTGRDWREKVLMHLDLLRMDNQQDDINACVVANGKVVAVLNSVICERPQTDWSDWGLVDFRHITNPRNMNSILARTVILAE